MMSVDESIVRVPEMTSVTTNRRGNHSSYRTRSGPGFVSRSPPTPSSSDGRRASMGALGDVDVLPLRRSMTMAGRWAVVRQARGGTTVPAEAASPHPAAAAATGNGETLGGLRR